MTMMTLYKTMKSFLSVAKEAILVAWLAPLILCWVRLSNYRKKVRVHCLAIPRPSNLGTRRFALNNLKGAFQIR